MLKISPFDIHCKEYDLWYEKNAKTYQLELKLLKQLIPPFKKAIEVGVGTGRFAQKLGINTGLDPSLNMLSFCKKRKITSVCGVAELLPFKEASFDVVVMVTTICFLDNVFLSFKETNRVLKKDGYFVLGFIDRNSHLGKRYSDGKKTSNFYKDAKFYTVYEVLKLLSQSGFKVHKIKQCIFPNKTVEKVLDGFGKGGFVGIKAQKKRSGQEEV